MIRKLPLLVKALKKPKKYGDKRLSIWRMGLLHPAMWHVALGTWQWIHQVAAPCNVIRGSGMTCHWIRPNVHHIGILHLVLISTISPQSTCHSAPICDILSKSDHPQQKQEVKVIWQKAPHGGAHFTVRGHPRGSKFVPLNSWGRGSY